MRTRRGALALAVVTAATVLALAGCAGSSAGSKTSTATDGATLVSTLCSRCHPIDRVRAAKKDRAGWMTSVERMVSHGLQVNATQQAAIIDYLTKRDGGQ